MLGKPRAKRIWPWLAVAIVLVAALFFFEWLGSERPQSVVEIEVQPGIRHGTDGASGND
ncbi:MAG: hypothetical protein KA292_13575 [Sphingorhabdus sp.]|nr:hypothetical protein [Sphingorhabdus sp.]